MNDAEHPLLTWRRRHGLTQRELGKRLDVTDRAVMNWESGLKFPRPVHLEMIWNLTDGAVSDTALRQHYIASAAGKRPRA